MKELYSFLKRKNITSHLIPCILVHVKWFSFRIV